MGRDDDGTKLEKGRSLVPVEYILSPASISPQTTVHGTLIFIITPFGFGGKIDNDILEYFASGIINMTFTYNLEINDVVSGVTITIPVPGKGYRG